MAIDKNFILGYGAGKASKTEQTIIDTTEAWLDEHIDPSTGYVLDRTLSMENAAAPADLVGDLKSATVNVTKLINNLADDLDFIGGYEINENGTISSNANYRYSDIVPTNGFTEITIAMIQRSSSEQTVRVLGYNASGVFVKQLFSYTYTGAYNKVFIVDCTDISGIRISRHNNSMIRAIIYGTTLEDKVVFEDLPYSHEDVLSGRLLASAVKVPPDIYENAYANTSYNYFFAGSGNKVSNGSFTSGEISPATINAGTPVISDEVYSSGGYSLKCFGASSTQVKWTGIYLTKNHYYILGCRVKVDRCAAGECGVSLGVATGTVKVTTNQTTNGFIFLYDYIKPTAAQNNISLFAGTISSADADCYVDDIFLIDITSTFADIDLSTAEGKNTAAARIFEMQNDYIDILNGKQICKAKYYSYAKPKFVTAVLGTGSDGSRFLATRFLLRIAECKLLGLDSTEYEKRLSVYTDKAAVCVLPEHSSMYQQQGFDVIYSVGATTAANPASITKVVAAITALPWITSIKNKYTIVADDLKTGSGNVFQAGDTVTIEDLLFAMMLPSSNTAATALAHYVGMMILGDQSATADNCVNAFVAEMAKTVASLGCTNSTFTTPSGLTPTGGSASSTTVTDLLKIGIEAASWDILNRIWNKDEYTINVTGTNARTIDIDTTVAYQSLEDAYMILGGKTGTWSNPDAYTLLAIVEPK